MAPWPPGSATGRVACIANNYSTLAGHTQEACTASSTARAAVVGESISRSYQPNSSFTLPCSSHRLQKYRTFSTWYTVIVFSKDGKYWLVAIDCCIIDRLLFIMNCSLEKLPALSSKIVRIFTSSTFTGRLSRWCEYRPIHRHTYSLLVMWKQ
jgi:hypothetical protein